MPGRRLVPGNECGEMYHADMDPVGALLWRMARSFRGSTPSDGVGNFFLKAPIGVFFIGMDGQKPGLMESETYARGRDGWPDSPTQSGPDAWWINGEIHPRFLPLMGPRDNIRKRGGRNAMDGKYRFFWRSTPRRGEPWLLRAVCSEMSRIAPTHWFFDGAVSSPGLGQRDGDRIRESCGAGGDGVFQG